MGTGQHNTVSGLHITEFYHFKRVKIVNVMLCGFYHTFLKGGGGRGENGKKNEEKFGHRVGGLRSSQKFIGSHEFP